MVQSSTQNPFPRSHFSKNSHFFSRSHSHFSKKTLSFLGESLVPEPANKEQEGGVRGRDAHRRSQRRRAEARGGEPD